MGAYDVTGKVIAVHDYMFFEFIREYVMATKEYHYEGFYGDV